jgi:predicted 3-demethylubiquinone-9 3-methyltransferase (glyoxalase superfamily)
MDPITPCLWFDDESEPAAKFYVSLFKKSKIKQVTRYTEAGPRPKGMVMTVHFELNGQPFMALNAGPQFKHSPAVSFMILCDTQKQIDEYWSKLTRGGGQEVECGWVTDKFGISWQVAPAVFPELISAKNPAAANRVMAAMMKMKKLDIATLKKAYAGK